MALHIGIGNFSGMQPAIGPGVIVISFVCQVPSRRTYTGVRMLLDTFLAVSLFSQPHIHTSG